MERINPYFAYTTEDWPLVRVHYHESPNTQQFDEYLGVMDELIARAGPRALVLDALQPVTLPAALRRKQAAWIQRHEQRLSKLCAGYAFVFRSPVQRGILTAILWLQPLPCPHTVLGNAEQAEAWCRGQLARF